jgi:hypothetical protein
MRIRTLIRALGILLALACFTALITAPLGSAPAQSAPIVPAARASRLIVTADRLAIWQRCHKEAKGGKRTPGAELWRALIDTADAGNKYADNGLRAAELYVATGDRKWLDKAWDKIGGFLTRKPNANFAREYLIEHVVMYDWLRDGLGEERRAQYMAAINNLAAFATARPVLTSDSDQTIGVYFGIALWYLTTADTNPEAAKFWALPWMGGLDITPDRMTLRNAISQYVAQARGGEWIESSEYNLGTMRLLMMGVEAVRTATGEEHFPDARAWFEEAAIAMPQMVTNDLVTAFQWGDVEDPRKLDPGARVTTEAMLAGLTKNPALQDHVLALVEQHGAEVMNGNTFPRVWYFFDPYVPRGDRRTMPLTWYAPGQGVVMARTGWDTKDSEVMLHARPGQPYVHHGISAMGDVQIYRHGAWALTHPLSYAGPSLSGEGTNSMTFATFSASEEGRYVVGQESGPGYTYLASTTGGRIYNGSYYGPPPTFLHEWTRSLVYLPSKDRSSDTVVIVDRVHAQDPRALGNFDRYRPKDQARITSQPAVALWFFHAGAKPTVDGAVATWTPARGQIARLTQVTGAPATIEVQDLGDLWANERKVKPGEKVDKWRLRIVPTTQADWQMRVQVFSVADRADAFAASEAVHAGDGVAEGVRVTRPGHPDTVLIFGARRGEPLPSPVRVGNTLQSEPTFAATLRAGRFIGSAGYTATWSSMSAETELLLFDLPGTVPFDAAIDGGSPTRITPSAGGVVRLSVRGAGQHTLRLTSSAVSPTR